jgi:phosphoglycolate phosphatase
VRADLLVLWDIDHTLIDAGTVLRQTYAEAFRKATGLTLQQPWRFDGRTELAAATEALLEHGLDRERAEELAAEGRALPGAAEALAAVGAVPGVHQSVLTGNLYELAVFKLEVFGLDRYVDFRLGAYGGDAFERTDLPEHAFKRTEQHLGHRHSGADTVIVGDTLRDIATARAAGARIVAVATGSASMKELAEADVVLPDLTDTDAVRDAVIGPSA